MLGKLSPASFLKFHKFIWFLVKIMSKFLRCGRMCLYQVSRFYCSFHISLSNNFGNNNFNFLLFWTETYMICVNVFDVVKNEISAGSDIRQRISTKTPIVKIAHFGNVMTLPKWAFFTWGYIGKSMSDSFVWSNWD